MDLRFDGADIHPRMISGLRFTPKDRACRYSSLNAKNREVISVTCMFHPLQYEYDVGENLLRFISPGRSPHVQPLP
jgi:hypothetical protein